MNALDQWLARPRKPFLEAVPRLRLVQALIAIPYIFTAFLVAHLVGAEDASMGDVLLLGVFATVAVVETSFLLLWLRRPLAMGLRQRHDLLWACLGMAVGTTMLGTSVWMAR